MGEQNCDLLGTEHVLADQALSLVARKELVEVVCLLHVEEAVEEIFLQLLISLSHGLIIESFELGFCKTILVDEPVIILFLHLILVVLIDVPCC